MAVLEKKEGNMWSKIGKTEVIMDNLDPTWVTSFELSYQFEKREMYKVTVYHVEDFGNLDNISG